MNNEKPVAFPKFSTFKPKTKSIAEDGKRQGRGDRTQKTSWHDEVERVPEAPRDASHSRSRVTHERFESSLRLDGKEHPSTSGVEPQAASNESEYFIIDRRGDTKNVQFGTLHRYSIPTYHRSGWGSAIGAPEMRIVRRGEDANPSLVRKSHHQDLQTQKRPFQTKFRPGPRKETRIVSHRDGPAVFDFRVEFIPLEQEKLDNRASEDISSEKGDDELFSFRSLYIPTRKDDPTDHDTAYSVDEVVEDVNDELIKDAVSKNAELVRRTKSEPRSAVAWIDLIHHQSILAYPGANADLLTLQEKRAIATVRLTMYQTALKSIDAESPDRDKLLVGMLKEGKLVWGPPEMRDNLDKALRIAPHSLSIWKTYLDFLQTGFQSFNVDATRTAFLRSLASFHGIIANAAPEQRSSFEEAQLYVFLRFTFFLREAGLQELSWAAWQTVLENSFFPGSSLESFESFWDREVLRIGEDGALGWSNSYEQQTLRSDDRAEDVNMTPALSSFCEYAAEELRLANNINLPIATDDGQCNDPYCYIMYSDIREIAETFSASKAMTSVVDSFLFYLGLPLTATSTRLKRFDLWSVDQFLFTTTFGSSLRPSQFGCLQHLFGFAFETFRNYIDNNQETGANLCQLIDRILLQLSTSTCYNEDIAEYHIAFRSHFFPDQVAKLAKRLLKTRPSSIRLYNAYAMAEATLGRSPKAYAIWKMALSMSTSSISQDEYITLVHSQLAIAVKVADESAVIKALLTIPSIQSTDDFSQTLSPITQLKIERYLSNEWVNALDSRKFHLAILSAECRALFEYVTRSHDLEASVKLYEGWIQTMTSKMLDCYVEVLGEAKIRLIDFHVRLKRAYRPGFVRDEISKSLAHAPNNTFFLERLAKYSTSIHLEDRVRASLRDELIGGAHATVVQWSFVMQRELHRYEAEISGYTVHSVRNLFSKALLPIDSPVSHSLAVWNLWFRFELDSLMKFMHERPNSPARAAAEKARQVLFDGLRHLPWSKDWALTGLKHLGRNDFMTLHECRQVYETLLERSLRLRHEKNED